MKRTTYMHKLSIISLHYNLKLYFLVQNITKTKICFGWTRTKASLLHRYINEDIGSAMTTLQKSVKYCWYEVPSIPYVRSTLFSPNDYWAISSGIFPWSHFCLLHTNLKYNPFIQDPIFHVKVCLVVRWWGEIVSYWINCVFPENELIPNAMS